MFGLKARDFSHLYYSSRRHPCPICGRVHNTSCRVKTNGNVLMVWCIQEFMHQRGDTLDLGDYTAHFAYPLRQNMGGAWYLIPKDSQFSCSYQPKTSSYPTQSVNPLSIPEIDRNFRLLQAQFPLTESDRQLLKSGRGLTDEQIKRGGYFSLPSSKEGIQVPKGISSHFMGLDANGRFNCYYSSIVCPIFNPNGQKIGAQRWQPNSKSKYPWLSNEENPARIKPYGELPLTFLKPTRLGRKAIALVEGLGFKPQIASDNLNQLVIGASGGQFISSPKLFKEYLKTAEIQGCDRRVEIFPDAGDLINDQVIYRWQKVVEFLQKLGYSVLIAYWGQHHKKVDPDIDELDDLSVIRYLCPSDFFGLKVA